LTIPSTAPVGSAVEAFGKLGLRYLVIVEEVLGLVIKRWLARYLGGLQGT
jgi:chloride channel 3/4/5